MSPAGTVLVVNSGSSSLKYRLLRAGTGQTLAHGLAERIGDRGGAVTHVVAGEEPVVVGEDLAGHEQALAAVLDLLTAAPGLGGLVGVGHRVVHGGPRFCGPTLVDAEVEAAIEALVPLAPLHNPANLLGIRVLRRLLTGVPHVAVFDTAFHSTIPDVAATYALPSELAARHGVRRYGFHGTSHQYVTRVAAAMLEVPLEAVNLIVCHIGNGASVTAVSGGRSVDTSMGMSPLEGLVMGTRSGDVDPGVLLHLAREEGLTPAGLDDLLNRRSGLKGLCGESDVRAVRALAAAGDPAARLALDVYAYRLRKYVGAYLAVVPGVHAVVFTAGVGEHDAALRGEVCGPLRHLGIRLDAAANDAGGAGPRFVDGGPAPVRVLVVPTDEEAEIAAQTEAVAGRAAPGRAAAATGRELAPA